MTASSSGSDDIRTFNEASYAWMKQVLSGNDIFKVSNRKKRNRLSLLAFRSLRDKVTFPHLKGKGHYFSESQRVLQKTPVSAIEEEYEYDNEIDVVLYVVVLASSSKIRKVIRKQMGETEDFDLMEMHEANFIETLSMHYLLNPLLGKQLERTAAVNTTIIILNDLFLDVHDVIGLIW
ncbi:hypothetical protein EDC94DRAFT_585503 [Helicostylum pulchrum]|nr:hypothetical protein EDC94DRAFT_585503 [Helicostylum pulchrum]